MSPSGLLLVVDGGGTKTHALLADLQGNVLARGLGPSSNLHNVGFDESCRALSAAIEGALAHVLGPGGGLAPPRWLNANIAAACFGLAGVDAPEDEAQVARWIREQTIAPRFMVVNDAELVLAGGTPEGWGVALVSGTGSVCLGRAPDGRSVRVGGWGPLLGDDGSGYEIAARALRAATRAADGRAEAPRLLQAVLEYWSLRDPRGLIRLVHAPVVSAAHIAGLAPRVLELAAQGEPACRAILERAAAELAQQVDTTVARLGLQRPPLALAGSVLGGPLREAVLSALRSEVGGVRYVADPPLEALALARRLLLAPPAAS